MKMRTNLMMIVRGLLLHLLSVMMTGQTKVRMRRRPNKLTMAQTKGRHNVILRCITLSRMASMRYGSGWICANKCGRGLGSLGHTSS
jgi:hypothetical protein